MGDWKCKDEYNGNKYDDGRGKLGVRVSYRIY